MPVGWLAIRIFCRSFAPLPPLFFSKSHVQSLLVVTVVIGRTGQWQMQVQVRVRVYFIRSIDRQSWSKRGTDPGVLANPVRRSTYSQAPFSADDECCLSYS